MSLLRNIMSGLRSRLRIEQGEREADEEVRRFLEMAVDEKMKEGMNREAAARAVRLERASLEITKEVIRDSGWNLFWRPLGRMSALACVGCASPPGLRLLP